MALGHPTNEHLAAYAGGTLSEGMSLLTASHLTYCPSCRQVVAGFELLGGALMLDEGRDTPLTSPSLDAALAALDTPVAREDLPPDTGTPLPMPIRKAVRAPIDDLGWKFRMPGLHEVELDGFEGEHVSLLRVRPGTGIFHHTHEGEEATLILSGEMQDGDTVYTRGQVALADQNDNHKPRVIGDEICYCLIVMSGSMRFTGPVGRALNLFTR